MKRPCSFFVFILIGMNSHAQVTVRTSNGDLFLPNASWTSKPFNGTKGTFFADVNGDGRADAIAVNDDVVTVYPSNGSSFFNYSGNRPWTSEPYYGTRGTYFADVNGDGKADAIVVNDDLVTVRISDGTQFLPNASWTSEPYYGSMGIYFADVNGDVKADAIVSNNKPVLTDFVDNDQDGMDDHDEQRLLERYSPLYKYSFDLQEEQFRPTDAIWYIQHCNLLTSRDGSINISQDALQKIPSTLIDTSNDNGGNSSIYVNHIKTSYCLDLPNKLYSVGYLNGDGHDWPEILAKGNIGLYGHVTPIPDAPGMYKIEYWQFFAYNRATTGWIGFLGAILGPAVTAATATVGDHAGDWTTVQLIVQAETGVGGLVNDKIVSIFHYHHGNESRFDMSNAKMSRPVAGNIKEFAQGDSYDAENTVELAMDNSGLYVHPVVYIEWGGHEFWPNVRGSETASAKHNGEGQYSYVCHDIPNLGEVDSPLGNDFGVIMGFNGYWGSFNNVNSNPPGPCLHFEWQWPANSPLRGEIDDKYFEH